VVTLDGRTTPAFRVLLPEHIRGTGLAYSGFFHIIPGEWQDTERGISGFFLAGQELRVDVSVQRGEMFIAVGLAVTNISDKTLRDVDGDICTAANCLPGKPSWANTDILPGSLPLDRDVQGRYWYSKITPDRLFALTTRGPVRMHPRPDDPDPDAVPQYGFSPSPEANARACYVMSENGKKLLYQAWNVPCRYCAPSPGNACMHLRPVLAETLGPGERVAIWGKMGMRKSGSDLDF